MGSHLRETLLSLLGSARNKEIISNLIEQLDEEGFDDFTRVRELRVWRPERTMVGIHCASANKSNVSVSGRRLGGLALSGQEMDDGVQFVGTVFSPARANYYRCLQTLLLLSQRCVNTAISQCF